MPGKSRHGELSQVQVAFALVLHDGLNFAQDALDRHNQGGHSVTTDQKNADKKTD